MSPKSITGLKVLRNKRIISMSPHPAPPSDLTSLKEGYMNVNVPFKTAIYC